MTIIHNDDTLSIVVFQLHAVIGVGAWFSLIETRQTFQGKSKLLVSFPSRVIGRISSLNFVRRSNNESSLSQ